MIPTDVLGSFQSWLPFGKEASPASTAAELERRKKALQDELDRDIARLAEERRAELHRIDRELAEAIEKLHAETARKTNERVQKHQKVLEELAKSSIRIQEVAPAPSNLARSDSTFAAAHDVDAQSSPRSDRHSRASSSHDSSEEEDVERHDPEDLSIAQRHHSGRKDSPRSDKHSESSDSSSDADEDPGVWGNVVGMLKKAA